MARKQKMKVYHGIPKSITDEHTLFYESCDGKLDNSYTVVNPISFYPNVTGYGVYGTTTDEFNFALTTECKIQTKVFTVDFWATMKTPVNNSYSGRLFEITFNNNSSYKIRLERDNFSDKFHLWENGNLVFGEFDFSSANINKPHHFRIIFKVGDYCKMYIDGKEPNTVLYQNKLTTTFEYISHIRLSGANFSVSDFHISNIDRGDYFPNLPKDFVEGKAVIKPRMGQQQIKGDPMYSQVTNLKVEASTGVEYPTLVDNNYYRHRHNPELSVKGANHWNAGSSFRIKGLNGEIISGVIDTDTALAKVTKSNLNTWNILTLDLDDVSKFSVGDTIVLYVADTGDYTSEATIQSIDTENKVITLASKLLASHGGGTWGVVDLSQNPNQYVFETTLSSSSPTVKTKEGTNVVGTWSGLGTNEATFTLGANTDITGQDLYVTYALTMPYGNSDFPEIPYEIERAWGDNGVEMKPVDEILIVDDFRYKVQGSLNECPHYASFVAHSTLKEPSSFTKDSYIDYSLVSTLNGKCAYLTNSTNTYIPQVLLAFNIVEIVERKLGKEIPSTDKVQWLRDNLDSITYIFYGVGSTTIYLKHYFSTSENWSGSAYIGGTSIQKASYYYKLDIPKLIQSDGFAYFLVHGEASDGTDRNIKIDYVNLEVRLKVDSTFTNLYCENTRAREDRCNPVLIQKETKTVKRYLPSKEYFVTENTKLPYKDVAKAETGQILCVLPHKIVTTNGTTTLTQGNDGVDNYTDKIVLPSGYNPYNFDSSPIRVSETDEPWVSHTVQLPIIRYWGGRKYHGVGATASGLDSCQTITTVTDKEGKQQYEMYAGLKNINGELIMVIRTDVRFPNNAVPPSTYTNIDYKLPNRPLIK